MVKQRRIVLLVRYCMSECVYILIDKSTSCRWRSRATRCVTANVLQTKVDAQCDKQRPNQVVNAYDGRCFWVIASYLSKVANFNLPRLHLTPPLGWPRLNFGEIFGTRKLNFTKFSVHVTRGWPCLGPPGSCSDKTQFVMYSQFCGWRHVLT